MQDVLYVKKAHNIFCKKAHKMRTNFRCLFSKKAHKIKAHEIMRINLENMGFFESFAGGKSELRTGTKQQLKKS